MYVYRYRGRANDTRLWGDFKGKRTNTRDSLLSASDEEEEGRRVDGSVDNAACVGTVRDIEDAMKAAAAAAAALR